MTDHDAAALVWYAALVLSGLATAIGALGLAFENATREEAENEG